MFFCALLGILLSGETLIRSFGHLDQDGNFWARSFQCYPYRIPLKTWHEKINQYQQSKNTSILYDPLLGWAPRPGSQSQDGYYLYNEDGIRADRCDFVVSKTPAPGVLRIVIVGDSFTRGDDVSFEDTWGYLLEKNLKKAGINAEVLNFGVGGYGVDQALLRWKKTGSLYDPQIIILGLPLENILRNGNLVRPFYAPSPMFPFFKPRFILEKGVLKLVDTPTPTPDKIMSIVEKFDTWEYSKYEYWYDRNKYQDRLFLNSRLISFCYSLFQETFFKKQLHPKEDLELLSLAIISAFGNELRSQGKIFDVLFLPSKENLNSPSIPFLENLQKTETVISPRSRFLEEAGKSGARTLIPQHYSAKANKIVADAMTEFILKGRA